SWPCWRCSSVASCNPPPFGPGTPTPAQRFRKGADHATPTRNTDTQSAEHSAARTALLEVTRPAESCVARHGREIELGGDARCLATRGTHRSRYHPGSRCPAVVAAAVPQGTVVLHAGHSGRPHPPPVRFRRAGTSGRLTGATPR